MVKSDFLQTEKKVFKSREGIINKCPQNDLFHDRRDVIKTSQMAVSQISLTVAVKEWFRKMTTWNPSLKDNC